MAITKKVTKAGGKKTTETFEETPVASLAAQKGIPEQNVSNQRLIETMTETANPALAFGGPAEFDPNVQTGFTRDQFGDKIPIGVAAQPQQEMLPAQPQPIQQQTQQQAGFGQRVAQFGVTPAVTAANFISRAIKTFTGQDIGEITAEQFANTDIGKAIGFATVGAEAAVLAAGGAALLGAKAPLIAQEIRLLQAGFPRILKAGVAGNSLATKALSSGVLKLAFGGAVVGLPAKAVNDSKKAIASSRTSLSLILDGLKSGQLSIQDAMENIDEIESQINSYERSMNTWSKISILNWLGGGKDNQVDALNAKRDVSLARQQASQILISQIRGQAR